MLETTDEFIADCARLIGSYHDASPFSMRQVIVAPCQPVNCYRETFVESAALARDRGVTIMALCPGTTKTEFFGVSGDASWLTRHSAQDVQPVVRTGLKYLEKRRQYIISGWANYILSLLVRLATRATAVKQSMKYFRPKK